MSPVLTMFRFLRRFAEPREQLFWPPRDEFVKARPRRKPARPTGSPFTYGSGLNPSLTGQSTEPSPLTNLRRRAASKRDRAGSDASSRSTSSSPSILLSDYEDRQGEEEDDEDDVPLGTLAARRRRESRVTDDDDEKGSEEESEEDEDLDPNRSVRIRRGSEGYEIRPRFVVPPPRPIEFKEEQWDRVEGEEGDEGDPYAEEMVSEGELDEDGNRTRRGQRYKYYVREEDSESDTEDEREVELPPQNEDD